MSGYQGYVRVSVKSDCLPIMSGYHDGGSGIKMSVCIIDLHVRVSCQGSCTCQGIDIRLRVSLKTSQRVSCQGIKMCAGYP